MRAGTLKQRVTIQAQSTIQDDYGQPIQTWADIATVWAEIKDVSGREYFSAQASQNVVQTKIRIRYRADVVPAMRVLHGATAYNTEAVLDQVGDKSELVLMCSKGLSDG